MSEQPSPLTTFCRTVRARSRENRTSLHLEYNAGLYGKVMSTLREELDSMIRVFYLLSEKDKSRREYLIKETNEGRKWPITDADMKKRADKLHGWVQYVYRFGCSFIHLSGWHDYRERDPLSMLTNEDKEAILYYMRKYHHGPTQPDPTLDDLLPYLPKVFDKIADNLEYYVQELEAGKTSYI